jgi:glycosyltransferase involved in cell wall biosynthesis
MIGVLIPVHNESKRVGQVIKSIADHAKRENLQVHILVINDGSTDDTAVLLEDLRRLQLIEFISYEKNRGKGYALRLGTSHILQMNVAKIIFMDGDGQHDPNHLVEFIKLLDINRIVFGYRILGRDVPLYRRFGNAFATAIFRRIFNIHRRDLLCGYIGFRKEILSALSWDSNDYGVEVELSTQVGKMKIETTEINVATIYLDKFKGVSLWDALKTFVRIPFWYFRY